MRERKRDEKILEKNSIETKEGTSNVSVGVSLKVSFFSLSLSEKMFELILTIIMEEREREREREETMWNPTHYNCIKIESAPKKPTELFISPEILTIYGLQCRRSLGMWPRGV